MVTEVLSAVTYRLAPPGIGWKSKVLHVDGLLRYAGDATFSWEGQDDTVPTLPSPGSESGDDPALDSDGQGEESSDSDDCGKHIRYGCSHPARLLAIMTRFPTHWSFSFT